MSQNSIQQFYDDMADDYHLIFADWKTSLERQREQIKGIFEHVFTDISPDMTILDCACGIGTQAIGLAQLGYRVHGTDLSPQAIARAKKEAEHMSVSITFSVADMRTLHEQVDGQFDCIVAFDNALPHLIDTSELTKAGKSIFAITKAGGRFIASIRDYDDLLDNYKKPELMSQRLMQTETSKRITFQLWEWTSDTDYTVTQFILTRDTHNAEWQTRTYTTHYWAMRRRVLKMALKNAGFVDITWLMPQESGYYQPVVIARKPDTS
ncbi:MAG: class I SAM-dependent methyltransferase [Chloroflexota bacterium]